MKLRRHIPNFVDMGPDYVPEIIEVNSAEEFYNIDFIKECLKYEDFYKFSVSGNHIMIEYNQGSPYYVIAIILDSSCDFLPKFRF